MVPKKNEDPEAYKAYLEYMNKHMKEKWIKRRLKAIEYLGSVCVVCGTTDNLEFDHVDPSTKIDTIGKLSSASEKKFWAEVDKCQLLCKFHHLEKSKANKELGGGTNRIDDYDHGSGHMYYKQRCRCMYCKQWKRDYENKKVSYLNREKKYFGV